MISATLALLLAQAALVTPSRDEVIGAVNTLQTSVLAAKDGLRTVTSNAARTRVCIKFAGGGSAPVGAVTVRAMIVIMSPQFQNAVGFALPSYAATWAEVREEYGAFEVQAVPTAVSTFNVRLLNAHIDIIREELDKRAAPIDATCEVAAVRRDDAAFGSVARCACRVDATCQWDPDGGGPLVPTAAPVGVTLPPNSFSGVGCKPKPCVTRFDGAGIDNSWPTECPR